LSWSKLLVASCRRGVAALRRSLVRSLAELVLAVVFLHVRCAVADSGVSSLGGRSRQTKDRVTQDNAPTHRSRKRSRRLLLEPSRKADAPRLENAHHEHRNGFRYLIAQQRAYASMSSAMPSCATASALVAAFRSSRSLRVSGTPTLDLTRRPSPAALCSGTRPSKKRLSLDQP
jgi:hypothetical protein